MAGSVSIGAGAPPAGGPPGPSSGSDGMKSPRSTTVCSASPISGSDLPEELQEACPARRRRQILGDVDEQPPAGVVHRPERRELPHRQPQGLHGVGHHLLMTDGDEHVVLLVADRRDREQRRDRPALDDVEAIVDEAPLDVLGTAEVRFDPPAQLREPHDLRIGQRRQRPAAPARSPLLRPACRRGVDGEPLGGDRLVDDLAVAHLVDVGVDQSARPTPRRGRSSPPWRPPSGWT